MTKLVLTILLSVIIFGGWCQPPSFIDSLKNEISRNNITEIVRVNLILKLAYYTEEPIQKLAYAEEALQLCNQHNIEKYKALAYNYIGYAQNKLGNRLDGIDALIMSAQLNHEAGSLRDEATALISIGAIFMFDKDLLNAISYQKQGLKIFTQIKDTTFIAVTQLNIGETYRMFGMLDSAEYYYEVALANIEDLKNKKEKSVIDEFTIKGNLGMVHLNQNKIEQAKQEITEALDFFMDRNDAYRASIYQSELGKIYIIEGHFNEGEQLIMESLEMVEKSQLKDQIRDFNQQLATFYEDQEHYSKALKHYKLYKLYDDSLTNIENVRRLEQQQSKFQLAKKDEEITALNKINRLQRMLGILILAVSMVVIIFIFVLINSNRKIKAFNQQIIVQKQIVEQRESEKALLLRELNHRVKNNLQMVASLLSLHSRQLKGHPAAEALMAGKYRVEALTLIHQKLYRDDIDTKIDIKDYIEELTQNLVMNFDQDFELELFLIPFVMKIDKAIPLGLIINELVTNSLKYGKKEGEKPILKISIQEKSEFITLTIQDNGNGLPENFDFKQTQSFGLKLVHSLINQLAGKIDWTSDNGTCWRITLNTLKIT